MFDDFTVVCYFREQSRVRTSLYSMMLKFDGVLFIEEFEEDVSGSSHY
jgi:hypothetical protein